MIDGSVRRLVLGLAVFAGLVLLLGALGWVGQRRLVYFPSQVLPTETPGGVQEVTLRTADGLDLSAWLVATESPGAGGSDGAGGGSDGAGGSDGGDRPGRTAASTVLVFHGNGGNRAGRLPLARSLAARGHDVLLVDYRGFGANPGAPSSAGLARDADAALDWVEARSGPPRPIVYLGESLGAGVAIELATRHPPDALVLRSPFTSLVDIARVHYGIVPAFYLRDRWPNLDRVADLDVPVLVVAGSDDEIVPTEQSRRVAEAAGGPSRFVVIDHARHNDRALLDGAVLLDTVDDFLATHLDSG